MWNIEKKEKTVIMERRMKNVLRNSKVNENESKKGSQQSYADPLNLAPTGVNSLVLRVVSLAPYSVMRS